MSGHSAARKKFALDVRKGLPLFWDALVCGDISRARDFIETSEFGDQFGMMDGNRNGFDQKMHGFLKQLQQRFPVFWKALVSGEIRTAFAMIAPPQQGMRKPSLGDLLSFAEEAIATSEPLNLPYNKKGDYHVRPSVNTTHGYNTKLEKEYFTNPTLTHKQAMQYNRRISSPTREHDLDSRSESGNYMYVSRDMWNKGYMEMENTNQKLTTRRGEHMFESNPHNQSSRIPAHYLPPNHNSPISASTSPHFHDRKEYPHNETTCPTPNNREQPIYHGYSNRYEMNQFKNIKDQMYPNRSGLQPHELSSNTFSNQVETSPRSYSSRKDSTFHNRNEELSYRTDHSGYRRELPSDRDVLAYINAYIPDYIPISEREVVINYLRENLPTFWKTLIVGELESARNYIAAAASIAADRDVDFFRVVTEGAPEYRQMVANDIKMRFPLFWCALSLGEVKYADTLLQRFRNVFTVPHSDFYHSNRYAHPLHCNPE